MLKERILLVLSILVIAFSIVVIYLKMEYITRKELIGFKIPKNYDCNMLNKLAIALEQRLEETKVFVGTKQTEYEYKHKNCIEEIHKIDDYINKIYGLNEEESIYVKNIAIKYRTGGGVKDERN